MGPETNRAGGHRHDEEEGILSMTISAEEISEAKKRTKYEDAEPLHEHDDCIRIAYEWLDAQVKRKSPYQGPRQLKHIIQKWGGRYVSQSDVEVAAELHPEIRGQYPRYNISGRLVRPSTRRLANIPQAKTQQYAEDPRDQFYAADEES
jgi:hypothetical protein